MQKIAPKELARRIIVPLDVSSSDEALRLVKELREHVGLFKVGLELVTAVGFQVVEAIMDVGGSVFLDCKFHDIPNTVARASRNATRLGVRMFTVHTLGGMDMMRGAAVASAQAAQELGVEKPIVLGVTVLTSIDEHTMNNELRIGGALNAEVVHLSKLAARSGIGGVVASPLELSAIREATPDLVLVVPGVRPEWAEANDQRRVLTPSKAIKCGADYLVIGRPITAPPRQIGGPLDAVYLIMEELVEAAGHREENHA